LVLMYCTFISLKAHSCLTRQFCAEELCLQGERKVFSALIWDDGFYHALLVYEEEASHNIRLHAAVWEGPLRQCPVWTIFISSAEAANSESWLKRVSRDKVQLTGVQVHIFCQEYREQRQRRGPMGAFELEFMHKDAQYFEEIIQPPQSVRPRGLEQ
ncbi:hypothetical protein E4U54_003721, partial [Claviceps lovelessii]